MPWNGSHKLKYEVIETELVNLWKIELFSVCEKMYEYFEMIGIRSSSFAFWHFLTEI